MIYLLLLLGILGCYAQDSLNCSSIPDSAFEPIVLRNAVGSELHVMPFGGTAVKFLVADKDGVMRDVILGFDDTRQYCENAIHPYFGAIIGRYANRIANGTFVLNNITYHTPLNDNNWDTLHGGTIGYDKRVWTVDQNTTNSVFFSYESPDGEMGFPGALNIFAAYVLTDQNEWQIYYEATAKDDTVINLSQHTYWNLNGFKNNSQDVLSHILELNADNYVEVDQYLIPTGKIGNVTTDFWLNFTIPKAVGKDIKRGTVTPTGGYDNAFVLNVPTGKPAAVVTAPDTGITLEMYTSQPSVQFYSGNFLDGSLPRKSDQTFGSEPQYYQQYSAVVLEAQHYPDSVHHPEWPTTILRAGQTFSAYTAYSLSASQ